MLSRAAFIFTLTAAAFAHSAVATSRVTLQQLLATPQAFHAHTVTVRGWFACYDEEGCVLKRSPGYEPRPKRVLLDLTQEQIVALETAAPHGCWLQVTGRFEYSQPHPDIPQGTTRMRNGRQRHVVTVWNGFGFHSCQITAITAYQRILPRDGANR